MAFIWYRCGSCYSITGLTALVCNEIGYEEIEKAIEALEIMPGYYVYECLIEEAEGMTLY